MQRSFEGTHKIPAQRSNSDYARNSQDLSNTILVKKSRNYNEHRKETDPTCTNCADGCKRERPKRTKWRQGCGEHCKNERSATMRAIRSTQTNEIVAASNIIIRTAPQRKRSDTHKEWRGLRERDQNEHCATTRAIWPASCACHEKGKIQRFPSEPSINRALTPAVKKPLVWTVWGKCSKSCIAAWVPLQLHTQPACATRKTLSATTAWKRRPWTSGWILAIYTAPPATLVAQ